MDIYLILSLITIPLASWRLANMLSDIDQEGLFNSLDWIRSKLGVRYNEYSELITKNGSIGAGLMCPYCSSVWFGIIYTMCLVYNTKLTFFVSLPFAISAIVIFLTDWRTRYGNKT